MPSSSSDLKPLDYFRRVILEARVTAKRHTSIKSLKVTLLRECDKLSMEYVLAGIDAWLKSLKDGAKKGGEQI